MEKLYNRTFCLGLLQPFAQSDDTLFICGKPGWINEDTNQNSRGEICRKLLKPKQLIQLEYIRKGVDQQHLIDDEFKVWDDFQMERARYDSLDLEDMKYFLDGIHKRCRNLIIDITLMNIRLLGALLAVLPFYQWEHVFCCYTEAGEYLRSKNGEDDRFDLKNQILGFDEIPNLQTTSDASNECAWIIFMGFEGSRLQALQQEAEPGRKYTIPVVSIPAMRTAWHNHAIIANMDYIETMKEHGDFKYVSAVNPFDVYNYLEKERADGIDKNIRMKISPVGTRLTTLGSMMFVLKNEQEILLTDNPYQKDENSRSYGRSYAYDLSYFFKTTKNKRFELEDD